MTVMKKTEQKDDAVSPVVGVMLMLVVTIIIAAVVAAFASGVTADVEKAPNAVLDVKIYENYMSGDYSYPSIQVKSIGGEPISTEDMVIKFSWTGNDGKDYSASYSGGKMFNYKDYNGRSAPVDAMAVMPLDGDIRDEYSSWYGNVTISNGDVLQTMGLLDDYEGYDSFDRSFSLIFGDEAAKTIKKGQKMHVVIMWNDYAIFDKEVIVL